jgi:plasmid stabilization system protein ParE
MSHHVLVLARARRDADRIAAWLFKRSPRGTVRWLLAYNSIKVKLAQNPLVYGLAPENSRVAFELRQIFFKTQRGRPYRALFTVAGNEVRILRVRGPHQRPLRKRDLPTS